MDLIVADSNGNDIEVVKGFDLDLAYGSDENDFEMSQNIDGKIYKKNYRLYVEGTEYGGIIDAIEIDTENEVVTYSGRTWHGILNSKIISPASGEDYYTISGDIVAWLRTYITAIGLNGLFNVPEQDARTITSTKFDRYCTLYTGGLLKTLDSFNLKMVLIYKYDKVQMYIKPYAVYDDVEQFSANRIEVKASQHYNQVNHLVCLGKGELSARTVVHLYADASGNITETKPSTVTGLNEYMSVYDYPNAESSDDLKSKGKDKLIELRSQDEVEATLTESSDEFDVGDKIAETENLSGLSIAEKITKKIVTMTDNSIDVSFEIGGTKY